MLLPDRYDILLGVIGSSQYAGTALCTSAGALIYDSYGYMPAFLIMAGLVASADLSALLWVPAVPTYCVRMAVKGEEEEEGDEKEAGISPFVLLPLSGCCLVNFVWGYIQVRQQIIFRFIIKHWVHYIPKYREYQSSVLES